MPYILDYTLYLTTLELVTAGIAERTIYNLLTANKLTYFDCPDRGKLIEFDSMRPSWQDMVDSHYGGDAFRRTQFALLEAALVQRREDVEIIDTLRLECGSRLDLAHRVRYKKAASVLAMLDKMGHLTLGKIRAFGCEYTQDFWDLVYAFILQQDIKLPASRRLKTKLKKYKKKGAMVVISKKFGNNNRSKINSHVASLLIGLYADQKGRKFNMMQVYEQYNSIAERKKLPKLGYSAVAKFLQQQRGAWELERHGSKQFKLHKTITANRRTLSGRNMVWQLDGTPQALWYYCPKTKQPQKLYALIVMDVLSQKVVGCSIGYTETSNLVFEGIKMGCKMEGVKPKEIRSDKGSAMVSGETKELFDNLGCLAYPTATGNARAKKIESMQQHINEKVIKYFENRSGWNITTKSLDSKQNPDKFKENWKDFPLKNEVAEQIRMAMALWNEMEIKKYGKSPNEIYEQAEEKGLPITQLELIEQFYIWRKKGKNLRSYRFDYRGLTMDVGGERYRYIPDVETAKELAAFVNQHADVTDFYVKYDPSDMSEIGMYILPNGEEAAPENMRLLCYGRLKGFTAETALDATQEEKERLAFIRETQKEQVSQAEQRIVEIRAQLEAENLLSGVIDLATIQKDKYNAAKLQVERNELMGFGSTISEDVKRRQAKNSLKGDLYDDLEWEDDTDEDTGQQGLDVYG